ncbi:hypothetical protein [Microbacterium rhizophilus]|uniref:hypothetical protein n=1 Tax=Microbacterium rhizophilus TaxID=3138934 RepID=UPI0031EE532E
MTPEMPNLGEMILTALLQAPGIWWNAVLAYPGPWIVFAAVLSVVILLRFIEGKLKRRRPRR